MSWPALAQQRTFNIESKSAVSALPEFARQADIQIIAPGRLLRGIVLPSLKGTYDVREALRMLLAGTNIAVASDINDVIALRVVPPRDDSQANETVDERRTRPRSPTLAPGIVDMEVSEIVVTANRRAERLGAVPASIAAFSAEDMDAKAVRSIDDITRNTPGISFLRGFGNTNTIAVRGVTGAGAGATGIYIDDTPIQLRTLNVAAYNVYPLVFDLDRVEVLRGPQGTLFGAGSMGGTMRFITPTPSLTDSSLYVRLEGSTIAHGSESYEAGGAYGAPLVEDKVGLRVSGWFQHQGGFIDKVDPVTRAVTAHDINSANAKVMKMELRAATTDILTISPSFYFQEQRLGDIGQYWEEFSNTARGEFISGITTPQNSRDRFILPALRIEIQAEGYDIFSNTSYFGRNERSTYDYSTLIPAYFIFRHFDAGFPNYAAHAFFINTQKVFAQEVRIQSAVSDSPLKWQVGGFYNNATQTAYEDIFDPQFSALIQAVYGQTVEARYGMPVLSRDRIFNQEDTARDEQYAAFGELGYTFPGGLTLTAGGRYAEITVKLDNFSTGPFNGGRTTAVHGSAKSGRFNPKFGLSWQRDEDSLYYLTASKGFRPGGINQSIPYVSGICKEDQDRNGGPAPASYDSDSIWNYEAGLKKSFLDRQFYIAASVYYLEWSNVQVGRSACGLNYIDNSGAASSKGFDVVATFKPIPDLTLGAALGYVDANYTKTIYGAVNPSTGVRAMTIAAGNGLNIQPWTMTANSQYNFIALDRLAYVRVDYEYRGGLNPTPALDPATSVYNISALRPDPTHFLTARAGVTLDAWELSVFVKNITDSRTQLSRFFDRLTIKGLNKGRTFMPRSVGVTATARY